MRSVAIALIALFAIGASALTLDEHATAQVHAMKAQIRSLHAAAVSVQSVGASGARKGSGKFNAMAVEYGNPCTTGTAQACQSDTRTGGDAGCGWDSRCVGSSLATGTCQYLTAGLSCGSTCTTFNSTTSTFPALPQCPVGTQCATTGSTGTAYTCGYKGATKVAVVGCSCTTSDDCQSPATCQSNVCSLSGRASLPTGAACAGATDCSSNVCTNSACAAKDTCTSGRDCAVNKVCNTTSSLCVDPIPMGGACYIKANGDSAVECAGFGTCYGEPSSWGVCTNYFSVSAGNKCYQNPVWCSAGLACDVANANGTCFSGAVCGNGIGFYSCPIGQHCGCSGSTPSCTGPVVSQSCVDKLRNAASACRGGPRDIPAVAENYNSASASSACISAQADFYCNRDCAGPTSAFARGSAFDLTSGLDYRQFSCANRAIIAYSAGQNFGCTRAYCPEGFNSAASTSASILVVLLAIISAVLAAPSN